MIDELPPIPFPPNPATPSPLHWGFDECSNAALGFARVRQEMQPCGAPYPCGALEFEPRLPAPITVHPIRGIDRVNGGTNPYPNDEVCRYHVGVGLAMRPDGLLQPLLCVIPNDGASAHQPPSNPAAEKEKVMCLGMFFVAQPGNAAGLVAGLVYGVVGIPNPPWMATGFEAEQEWCGAPR